MKILFVSSGKNKNEVSTIVKNQGESLQKIGMEIEYFIIKDRGIRGYLSNIPKLRKHIKSNRFDTIHAHYSKSAYVATLASFRLGVPVICSLMGSDIQAGKLETQIISFFYKKLWKQTIVKSERMKKQIGFKKAKVLPNGVNFDRFIYLQKSEAQDLVGFDKEKKNIIWVSNPDRYEKNYKLAVDAVNLLNNPEIKLNIVNGIAHQDIPKYMYAADMLLLTSLWEGSPNVIKEAMACNLPIVSTDVGDVKNLIENIEGCFICDYNVENMTQLIKQAISFNDRTEGRIHIENLNESIIAHNLTKIYENCMI